jgi:hypothetical protein
MTEEEREATRARYECEMIAQRQRLDLITGLPEYAGKKKKDSTTVAPPA